MRRIHALAMRGYLDVVLCRRSSSFGSSSGEGVSNGLNRIAGGESFIHQIRVDSLKQTLVLLSCHAER